MSILFKRFPTESGNVAGVIGVDVIDWEEEMAKGETELISVNNVDSLVDGEDEAVVEVEVKSVEAVEKGEEGISVVTVSVTVSVKKDDDVDEDIIVDIVSVESVVSVLSIVVGSVVDEDDVTCVVVDDEIHGKLDNVASVLAEVDIIVVGSVAGKGVMLDG